MEIQAEVSLYPMGEKDVLPAILDLIRRLEAAGLRVEPGPLSTLVSGECGAVFAALGEAYAAVAEGGRRVLVVKVVNGRGVA
jgi:uncharacterized protein YqgV (UPF0045/DUF77 family)